MPGKSPKAGVPNTTNSRACGARTGHTHRTRPSHSSRNAASSVPRLVLSISSTGSANRPTMAPPTESPRGSALAALTEHDMLLVDALAERVAELLRPAPSLSPGLLTAAQLAQALNVSRAWVYENAGRLGARKLGDGPRARLRFDLETARAATGTSGVKDAPKPAARRPRPCSSKSEVGRVLAERDAELAHAAHDHPRQRAAPASLPLAATEHPPRAHARRADPPRLPRRRPRLPEASKPFGSHKPRVAKGIPATPDKR